MPFPSLPKQVHEGRDEVLVLTIHLLQSDDLYQVGMMAAEGLGECLP